jgi:hypothetical protein
VLVAIAAAALCAPAAVAEASGLLQSCSSIAGFHDRLTNAKGKQTSTEFGSKRDVARLKVIARQLVDANPAGARTVAAGLRKVEAGTPRRNAVSRTFHWCDRQGAYDPTTLTLAPRFDAVDTDAPLVTGTSAPGAGVSVLANGARQSATADAAGAFSFAIPNLPLDTDVTVTLNATESLRGTTTRTAIVRRTRSQAAIEAEAQAQAEAARAEEEAFKADAPAVSYDELTKDPDALKGRRIHSRAQVFQYDARTGTAALLVEVTAERIGSHEFWSDNVLLRLPSASLGAGIDNHDIIEFWGEVAGAYSYGTAIGGTNTVPEISVRYMNLVEKREA